ncbi:uncharacterized protein [Manis javanica]|uniref:uncharacterized protein isoform X3 n=1 Tax=Manis javanica TaxID=9974 RepID=UPI003C6D7C8A
MEVSSLFSQALQGILMLKASPGAQGEEQEEEEERRSSETLQMLPATTGGGKQPDVTSKDPPEQDPQQGWLSSFVTGPPAKHRLLSPSASQTPLLKQPLPLTSTVAPGPPASTCSVHPHSSLVFLKIS